MSSHVTILAAGTRGDVQPYVALALGLLDAGHDVTLAANAEFRALVEAYDVPFSPLRADYLALADTPEGRAALQGNPLTATRRMRDARRADAAPHARRRLGGRAGHRRDRLPPQDARRPAPGRAPRRPVLRRRPRADALADARLPGPRARQGAEPRRDAQPRELPARRRVRTHLQGHRRRLARGNTRPPARARTESANRLAVRLQRGRPAAPARLGPGHDRHRLLVPAARARTGRRTRSCSASSGPARRPSTSASAACRSRPGMRRARRRRAAQGGRARR